MRAVHYLVIDCLVIDIYQTSFYREHEYVLGIVS